MRIHEILAESKGDGLNFASAFETVRTILERPTLSRHDIGFIFEVFNCSTTDLNATRPKPNLISELATHKASILAAIIKFYKEYRNDQGMVENTESILKTLIWLGVKWPELTVIQRSIDASNVNNPVNDLGEDRHDVDPDDYDEIYGRIGQYIGDLNNSLSDNMSEWDAEIVNNALANISELLDTHAWLDVPTASDWGLDLKNLKPLIIKSLLIGVKHPAAKETISLAIQMLEDYWNVSWPELVILRRRLDASTP